MSYTARMSSTCNRTEVLCYSVQSSDAIEIRNGTMFDFYPGLPHIHMGKICEFTRVHDTPSLMFALCMPSVFFRAFRGGKFPPLSFKIPPQTITNFVVVFFQCFSYFLSPQKQFPPLNYISRKNPVHAS